MCVYLDVVAHPARKLLQESRFWGREFSSRQNVLIGYYIFRFGGFFSPGNHLQESTPGNIDYP